MMGDNRIMVHTCCAPCLTGVHHRLLEEGYDPVALWYNPNIHPFIEWEKRLSELIKYRSIRKIETVVIDEYPLKRFLKGLTAADDAGGLKTRCSYCISERLNRTAQEAKKRDIHKFTTTLLISKYQPHDTIKRIGRIVGKRYDVDFVYIDFRNNWKDSVKISRALHLYHQGYCGCIFSEMERYREEWEEGKRYLQERGLDIWYG